MGQIWRAQQVIDVAEVRPGLAARIPGHLINFLRWGIAGLFPHHRAHRRFRALRWLRPHEAYFLNAVDLADLERRMRLWINGW